MGIKFFQKNEKFKIGLDITPEGITAVLLAKDSKGLFVKNCGYTAFDSEIIRNGIVINPEGLSFALEKVLKENGFAQEQINIAVPGNIAFIKTVSFPNIPDDELALIVPQEASKHVPLPINDVNIDFEVIDENSKSGKKDVLLVGLAKSAAKSYVDAISQAGYTVSSIDISSFAMIRTLANAGYIDDSEDLSISVFIGYENTDINIIKKGKPLFLHSISIGKKHILESLMSGLEIDMQAALAILPNIALVIPGIDISSDPQLNKAAATVRSIYSNIATETQKIIEFYNTQYHSSPQISKVVVGGIGVCVQNIDKYFENRFKIPSVICDSLKKINHSFVYQNENDYVTKVPSLASSIGLALKGIEN